MELQEAQQKLSPTEYRELLQHIELRDLYLKRLDCLVHSREISNEANIHIQEEVGETNIVEGIASIEQKYSLKASTKDSDLFEVNAVYILNYSLKKSLPEEFFAIYKAVSVTVHAYPYFRELVGSLSARMGLPNLTLPLRKVG